MRKLNTILSVLLLFICLLHGLMGSFMLLGISSGAGKFLAWIGVGILAAHTVLGLLLTAQIFRASRYGGKPYGKQNALFWARRASGLAILLIAAYPFMLNLLIRDFPPHSSDTPLVRRSESSLHSQAGHCR